jgi:hypothetical protein
LDVEVVGYFEDADMPFANAHPSMDPPPPTVEVRVRGGGSSSECITLNQSRQHHTLLRMTPLTTREDMVRLTFL